MAILTKKIVWFLKMNFNIIISIIIIIATLLMLILLVVSSKTYVSMFHRLYNPLLKKNFKNNWRFFSITQFNCLLVLYILCRNGSIGIFIHNMYIYIFANTPAFNVIPLPIVIFTLGMSCLFSIFKMRLDRIENGRISKLSLFFFMCLFTIFLWAVIAFFAQNWDISMNGFNLQIGYFLSILISIIEHCIDSNLFQYSADGFLYKGSGLLDTAKSIIGSYNLNSVPYDPDQGNSNNSNNSSNNPSNNSLSPVWNSAFKGFSPDLKAQIHEITNRPSNILQGMPELQNGGLNNLNLDMDYIRKLKSIFAELKKSTGLLLPDVMPEIYEFKEHLENAKMSGKKYPNVLRVYDATIENVTNRGVENTELYDKKVAKQLADHKATVDKEVKKMDIQKKKVFSVLDLCRNMILNDPRIRLSHQETNSINRLVGMVKSNLELDLANMNHFNNNLENQTPPQLKYNDDVD